MCINLYNYITKDLYFTDTGSICHGTKSHSRHDEFLRAYY